MKAQTDVISAVIILLIAMGLISAVYMWGIPLIQKSQDNAVVERVYKNFDKNNVNSIERKIEYVANNGGEETFTVDTEGIWYLNEQENYIQFFFLKKSTNIAENLGWVPLSSSNTNPKGTIGTDDSYVVYGMANTANDKYNITYKVWFRELWDDSGSKGYKIQLTNAGPSQFSTSKSLRISRGETKPDAVDNRLFITEIKILFG